MSVGLKQLYYALLFTVSFSIIFSSCSNSEQKDTSNLSEEKISEYTPGAIIHDSLSVEQLEKIKKIHSVFSEVDPLSLEETITNFKRDKNPDSEIAAWLTMASAYEKFIRKNPTNDLAKKLEVYKLVLIRSMSNEADAKASADLQIVTEKEANEILSYYTAEPNPLKLEIK